MKLASSNKMLALVQSSISHEMLTPIKCIVETVRQFRGKFKDSRYDKDT